MSRYTTLIFSIVLLMSHTLANDIVLKAYILDAYSQIPIEGCEIVCGANGTTSDAAGEFTLVCDNQAEISFNHIGYESFSITTSQVSKTIILTPNVLEGSSVQVVGAFSSKSLMETESSITVINKRDIENSSEANFQKLIELIPNLNWAGGSSRPRYFQIRGIGERSQYAGDGPPNFSVGFSMDDLDISGIGMAGQTYDVGQVELFRGPQSSIYGPNALAGFIALHSNEPDAHSKNTFNLSFGNSSTLNLGAALNVYRSPRLGVRVAVYRGYNDGFRYNQYLDDNTTNKHLDTMIRVKANWNPIADLMLKMTLISVELDNGYDAWTPDNNGFITYTNKPGEDSQRLNGAVVRAEKYILSTTKLVSITSYSQAKMIHSYDSDWGNDDLWEGEPYGVEGWSYDYFDTIDRQRTTTTQELRFQHGSSNGPYQIIMGAYYKNLVEEDAAEGYLFGGAETELDSQFDLLNRAIYGEIEYELTKALSLTANIRLSERQTGYSDDKLTVFDVSDRLTGGKLALLYHINPRSMVFANMARGFKAGGINQHPRILEVHRPFRPEYVNNAEFGYRGASSVGMISMLAFYSKRFDQQVSLSSQQDASDPNSFTYYIGNAATGSSYGFEMEYRYRLLDAVETSGSLGLLQSNTDAYSFEIAAGEFITLGDREFSHAPRYTYRLGLAWDLSQAISANISYSGKDKFYFSESHDQMSEPYGLINTGLTVQVMKGLSLRLWADNLLDTKYEVRGFYFGLEPPTYAEKLYVAYGDPLHYGLSMNYSF
jgi:outer membrane receptor protein involved in Fe transport